ncbi:RNA Metabolism [Methylobacterium phyllosphaerae]|uniref:RNA Metabolism n=2 Tax=Methylobacterium phyllosphaerae TaxID=418223 RepID=A0AAE8HVC1_9HYPH|nr:RNA Metabolism [Methylobacterium phyllosphaerae]SFH36333.1 hypothetical protein SAMN05192567_121114 [Methylobacterium phyllosphaerae]
MCIAYVGVALWVNHTIGEWKDVSVFGVMMPPGLLLVGLIFVMRDYTQQAVGNGVIVFTLIAAWLTYAFIGHDIGMASGTAFAVSECIDCAVFIITKRSLKNRILISSAISTPFDGLIFLGWMKWIDPWHFWSQPLF